MSQDADLLLVQNCLAGREGSWEAFVERFTPLLAEACRRTLRRCRRPSGPQEVKDMLQQVFLALLSQDLRALRGYRGRGSLTSYLAAVAVRRVLDDRTLGPLRLPDPPVPAEAPPDALEAQEELLTLREELSRLPARAGVGLLMQSEGASLAEVGRALGISADAAAHLLARAREVLRDRIKNRG